MPESPPTNAASANQPGVRRQPTWFIAAITLLVIGFLTVVVMRDQIRSRWYAYRLINSTEVEKKAYYISLLSQLGDNALSALEGLSADPDPNNRSLAVFAIKSCSDRKAAPMLGQMLYDKDRSVRDAAATALAFLADGGAEHAIHVLQDATIQRREDGELAAAAAAASLARVKLDTSARMLVFFFVSKFPPPPLVRAQAIESIGALAASHNGTATEISDLFTVVLRSVEDHGAFKGPLALENEIAAASDFVAGTTGKTTSVHLIDAATNRRVCDIARGVLLGLTDQKIEKAPPKNSEEEKAVAKQICEWYEAKRARRATSMPTSLPDF